MINRVILMGRLVADPELKTTNTGVSVTSFSIAVDRKYQPKGEEKKADFIDCVAWRNTAEFVSKYFNKGRAIVVVGSLQNRSWTDQNGQKRYITEVVVDEVSFVDSKGDNSQYQSSSDNFGAPSYSTETAPDFEVISADQDLPF